MPLGREDIKPTCIKHSGFFDDDLSLDTFDFGIFFRAVLNFRKFILDTKFQIAAKLNVGATTSHVRCNGHRPATPRLSHDVRLHLVETRIQHLMLDALFYKEFGEQFGFFNRYGAN